MLLDSLYRVASIGGPRRRKRRNELRSSRMGCDSEPVTGALAGYARDGTVEQRILCSEETSARRLTRENSRKQSCRLAALHADPRMAQLACLIARNSIRIAPFVEGAEHARHGTQSPNGDL